MAKMLLTLAVFPFVLGFLTFISAASDGPAAYYIFQRLAFAFIDFTIAGSLLLGSIAAKLQGW